MQRARYLCGVRIGAVWLLVLAVAGAEWWGPARPLPAPRVHEAIWVDPHRNRPVPVRCYLPDAAADAVPVVVFSHGLGGTRRVYAHLGRYLAALGYLSVHPQHRGSDAALFRRRSVLWGFIDAVGDPAHRRARVEDLRFVLDRLLAGAVPGVRIDRDRIAVGGHSYGAWAALELMGQTSLPGIEPDPRPAAVFAVSPIGPGIWGLEADSWDDLRGPAFFLTGDEDTTIGTADWRSRRVPFRRGGGRPAWLVVVERARHHAFGDYHFPYRDIHRDPRHHLWMLATLGAFLDATVRGDPAARAWLASDAAAHLSDGEVQIVRRPQAK